MVDSANKNHQGVHNYPQIPQISEKYGLQNYSLDKLAAWPLGDFIFQCDWDVLLSSTKVQQAGFHSVVDSEEMFLSLFQRFRDLDITP